MIWAPNIYGDVLKHSISGKKNIYIYKPSTELISSSKGHKRMFHI